MKKTFTFLFAIGLASSVFAQGDNSRNHNQANGFQNQPSNYSKSNTQQYHGVYQGDNGYNQNNQFNYNSGYGNQRNNAVRNDDREFHNDYPMYNRGYEFGRKRWLDHKRFDRRQAWFNRRYEKHERW